MGQILNEIKISKKKSNRMNPIKKTLGFLTCSLFSLILLAIASSASAQYEPTWDSLDSRPLPEWYMDAKVGIFMHFGPYAVPGKIICLKFKELFSMRFDIKI